MARYAALSFSCVLVLWAWIIWPKTGSAVTAGRAAPAINGENWINSKPLAISELRGRVVLVEFWTYG
ncbi:MAG TPA: hypothetical protein VEI95_17285 [Acidobacteriota bacterium]|nr:hypothetical protein [Acidobacteriota bacterium]